MRLMIALAQLPARLCLAIRYWMALGYSWNLAWIKAERKWI